MKSEQTDKMELLVTEEMTEGFSFEEIIEGSTKPEKTSLFRGVYTTQLLIDEFNQTFCIQNPYNLNEMIAVFKSTIDIEASDVNKEVLISFERENVYQPVVTGFIKTMNPGVKKSSSAAVAHKSSFDGKERLVFSADKEIVLQCGKSSIHLTKAGKVIIRGSYLLSRSSGLNSIKGGSVAIN